MIRNVLAALLATGAALSLALWQPWHKPPAPVGTPHVSKARGYIGSGACRMCHPAEYDSWHETFHRTMTRPARSLSWNGEQAPHLPVSLEAEGFSYKLFFNEEGQVIAEGPDLHEFSQRLYAISQKADREGLGRDQLRTPLRRALEQTPRVRRRLVMTTGSHHYLAFWLEGGAQRELRQLPFVYLLAEQKWAPRSQVFLQPPNSLPHVARWNANCIQCHAVAGQPRESESFDPATQTVSVHYETEVAELGIACEACHGPGERHARKFRSPLGRALARGDHAATPGRAFRHGTEVDAEAVDAGTLDAEAVDAGAPREPEKAAPASPFGMIHPKRLGARRASALCGQCHSYFVPKDPEAWWETGFVDSFRAGELLEASREVLLPSPQQLAAAGVSRTVRSIFWGDGSIRVGGREYNGLLASPCFRRGSGQRQMRCGSCHSLHQGTRIDQLSPPVAENVNAPCKDCHADTEKHSGHPSGSAGASCVNCHMPKTTYALLKAIRSHRITSPRLHLTDPPSACVLCHVDRSRGWLRTQMSQMFPELLGPEARSASALAQSEAIPETVQELPLGVHLALRGDAATRAVLAAALGSPETLDTVGSGWPRLALRQLRRDPYHAVRRIAERSLTQLPDQASTPPFSTGKAPARPQKELASHQKKLLELLQQAHQMRDRTPVVISE